ncbi:universal stress protein [Breoghania sp. L-A4]|uniref:universal stress protein n=1 Tax=Breoghania sp. L-A4 TaxID=2304600 RepID=UPI000E35EEB6|nr:universal stress protein [Breoghania sp. L-A4]AXS41094.1 universal stress protein [Breoghania sp. L-A4]
MYKRIMVPVDLAHLDQLEKALQTAADIAERYGASVLFVGVTATTPGPVAHNPEEFAEKLEAFAASQGSARGIPTSARAYASHDPSIDLDDTLMRAIADGEIDLVVMASHVPGMPEHIFASNAGHLAAHARVSVMVVRP